jgi:hypothetical protein
MSVKAFVDGQPPAGRLTPLEVADAIDADATTAVDEAARLAPRADAELAATLADIRAMGLLGRYYAEKIRGAADLYRCQKTPGSAVCGAAKTHLQGAANRWREYAAVWSAHYVPQTLTRMGATPVDIAAIQAFVDKDVP